MQGTTAVVKLMLATQQSDAKQTGALLDMRAFLSVENKLYSKNSKMKRFILHRSTLVSCTPKASDAIRVASCVKTWKLANIIA